MASRQPNTNWHNIPGTSQVSWRTEVKPNCDCPHDDINSHTRSKSEAGLTSAYHVDPLPVQNRYASFSSTSTSPHVSQFSSPSQSRGTSVATSAGSSRNVSQRPSLVDLVKALPPVLESSSGTRFNAAEFATSLERPLAMRERHQKIRSAIETLESIIRHEEQEYQRRQQKIIEQQRILEQQRLQEQQRLEEQQKLQEQQRQQQQFSNNTNWNQSTNSGYARNGSVSIFDEIQAEHDQRAYEASLKKEEGRGFGIFKSKKKAEVASPMVENRERKASEWAANPVQFRERQGSDWYTTATEAKQRKGSSDLAGGMGEFRDRQDSGWYSAASERKASIVSTEANMRKGSTVSMASNFRKGSTAGMPKQRRPSEWGASTACFA